MQHPFSCTPRTYQAISATLSPARLGRYLPAANGDHHLALRLYVWNAQLCEAFYLPVQMAEIAARNAIHKALLRRYGANWDRCGAFLSTLPHRLLANLEEAQRTERQQHGANLNVDHLVSALPFGFWVNLTTQRYGHLIWKSGFQAEFPNIPRKIKLHEMHGCLDRLRRFRNRIAHQNAIFDKKPAAELQNMLEILSWICTETHWFTKELSNVSRMINARPRA